MAEARRGSRGFIFRWVGRPGHCRRVLPRGARQPSRRTPPPFLVEIVTIAPTVPRRSLTNSGASWSTCAGRLARAASAFGWVSPGARARRQRVGELAAAVLVAPDDFAGLKRLFGRRWAYLWRPVIMCEPERRWREMLHWVATEHGGDVARKPMLCAGSEVLAWWHSLSEFKETGALFAGREGFDWNAFAAGRTNGLEIRL